MRNSFVKEKVAMILEQRWGQMLNAGKSINGFESRYNTAVLLENQRQYMARAGMLNEIGTTADVTGLPTTIFPIIRRVYPNIIANEIVGVQALTSPTAAIFYLQYYSPTGKTIYGSTKTQNDELLVWNANTGRFALDESYSGTLTRNEYHKPVDGSTTFGGNTITTTPEGGGTGSSLLGGTVKLKAIAMSNNTNVIILRCFHRGRLVASNTYTASGAVGAAADKTYSNGSLGTYHTSNGWTTPPNFTNTAFSFSGQELERDVEIYADYNYQTGVTSQSGNAYNAEGDGTYGYNDAGNFPVPSMEMRIFSDQVKVTKRALKTAWTIEDEQDMKAFHNIDVEKELVTVMSSEIAAEIDREILTDLQNNVGFEIQHDWATGNVPGLPSTTHPGLGMVYDDLAKALVSTITAASNEIYRRTMRGAANWIVINPTTSARFEALNQFKYNGNPGDTQGNLGIAVVGTLAGGIKVIKDPLRMNNSILLGFKGGSFMDCGYVYCPYIPVTQIDTFTDPGDFTKRKACLTRYGKTMVKRGYNYYGSISVVNTPDIFTHFYQPVGSMLQGAQSGPLSNYATDNPLTTNGIVPGPTSGVI